MRECLFMRWTAIVQMVKLGESVAICDRLDDVATSKGQWA
jgi:hypothetical protein